jgi:hypothetical protein
MSITRLLSFTLALAALLAHWALYLALLAYGTSGFATGSFTS